MYAKLIGALVGVMLTGNAWAANVEATADDYDTEGAALCYRTTGNFDVCLIRYAATEEAARDWASSSLDECNKRGNTWRENWPYQSDCAETRAYIKQRWGY